MVAAISIAGQKFGRITAIDVAGSDRHGKIQWNFICDCGTRCVVAGSLAKRGSTQSCGCLGNETRGLNAKAGAHKISKALTKHGLHGTPEYKVWKSMRSRCNTPTCQDYADYGGRGIKVCDRWNDFANFIEDMGSRPSDDHSIDRTDNDLGYGPSNCRWATDLEQASNRRKRRAA